MMSALIRPSTPTHSSVAQLYERQLLSTKLLSTADATKYRKDLFAELDKSLVAAKPENFTVPEVERPRGWSEMRWPAEGEWKEQVDTGVDGELLREVGRRSVEVEEAVVSLGLMLGAVRASPY